VVVRRRDEQVADDILLATARRADALAAPPLGLVGAQRHALDEPAPRDRDRDILLADERLDVDVARALFDRGLSLPVRAGAVPRLHLGAVVLDDREHAPVVAQDRLVVLDLRDDLVVVLDQPFDLEAHELDQAHRADLLGLHPRQRDAARRLGQLEPLDHPRRQLGEVLVGRGDAVPALHQLLDRLGPRAARADQRDHLVDVAHRVDHALEHVGPLLGLAEQVGRAPADHLVAVVDVEPDELPEPQRPRLAVHQRDVDDAEGLLQRGVLVELVLDDRRVGALLELDDDPRAGVPPRLVADIADVLEPLVLDRVDDLLDQRVLHEAVGDAVDDELLAPVLEFLGVHLAPDGDAPAPVLVGLEDAPPPLDHAPGREVGALDALVDGVAVLVDHVGHQLGERDVGVVDRAHDRVEDLAGLCGGRLVAMPTAMPMPPLISRLGNLPGSTVGSVRRSS
jgi:hypothetical protein